ncbi:E3 ubiquitin-protein ligase RGLG3-like [Cucumis sativus]|uniref:E3 ubiquitin-protein ligase RGLG3-like n=1 Tax=Cucumis sativus TaxID=3659 RepID=UPI0012F4E9FB|nr:E3 ubiquitin-protein ligase RGLG3-like [Cucumis sativus]
MSESIEASKKEAAFALATLMEIPFQYRATLSLPNSKLLCRRESVYGKSAGPLPPPPEVINYDNAVANQILENAKAEKHSSSSESVCPICLTNPKDMAFACGHTTLALCV